MDRERHEQIKAVFLTARESPKEGRAQLLNDRCGKDSELRQEVESLLQHDDAVQMAASAQTDASAGVFGATIGGRISNFQIQRVIGVGGMGIVYEALQEQPRRTVALKVLRRGIATDSVLRRFKHEAEILGKLQHPGIAQIYEAGVHTDGAIQQPYFAMEFIAVGKPITDYVKEEELSLHKRLELFAQVCDAVHYGHEQGVIHRDLKPGNILINADGQPKIIDFGVARSTNADMAVTTLQTDVGELIGTLQYMSPEQCAGSPDDLDRRTDVYALGIILYELLCDQLPYDLSTIPMLEAMRTIREAAPSHPSTIDRTLRGDVETIVLRTLRKDREERYESAAELADDIRRYLHAEPIVARSPTLLYQARMFARRHRPLVTAAVAVLILLMVGVSLVTYLFTQLRAAARDANIAANVIRSVELHLRDTGSYSEPSRALIYSLKKHERTSHGGRTLILFPYATIGQYHSMFFLDAAGNESHSFDPDLTLPDHPGFARFEPARGVLMRGAVVGDLLPDHPGTEVAVALCDEQHSPCVIEIWNLDMTGEPLAELWSVGHVQAMYWNEAAGMLFVVARSNALPSVVPQLERWHELAVIRNTSPSVFVGWRPQRGRQVLFPLAATPEYSEADLEFMVIRKPAYDAELALGKTSFITSCLIPDPTRPETICRIGTQESHWAKMRNPPLHHGFAAHVSPQAEVIEPFVDEDGQSFVEVTGLPEPELITLDLPLLREAKRVVDELGEAVLDLDVTVRRLRERSDLPTDVRETAATMLRLRYPNAAVAAVRPIVDQAGLDPHEYERALALAQRAAEMRPSDRAILTALGIAKYRAAKTPEDLDDALATLEEAEKSNHQRPARVAVMAMILERRGRHEQALEELARMEEEILMDGPYSHSGQELVEEAKRTVGGGGH